VARQSAEFGKIEPVEAKYDTEQKYANKQLLAD
jgi:hypothetical protein